MDPLDLNLSGVIQAQRQLIAPQLHLNGVPHGRHLAQRDLGARGQPHIQQMVPQFSGAAHHLNDGVLTDLQFCKCQHFANPSIIKTSKFLGNA